MTIRPSDCAACPADRRSTRGLDASSALTYVQALRTATDLAQTTTIVSIYQCGESLYDLCVVSRRSC